MKFLKVALKKWKNNQWNTALHRLCIWPPPSPNSNHRSSWFFICSLEFPKVPISLFPLLIFHFLISYFLQYNEVVSSRCHEGLLAHSSTGNSHLYFLGSFLVCLVTLKFFRLVIQEKKLKFSVWLLAKLYHTIDRNQMGCRHKFFCVISSFSFPFSWTF